MTTLLVCPRSGSALEACDDNVLRRPQRDLNSKTDDHENINRGAALRSFVSDSEEFVESALGRGGVGGTVAFPAVVARAWQKLRGRTVRDEIVGASHRSRAQSRKD